MRTRTVVDAYRNGWHESHDAWIQDNYLIKTDAQLAAQMPGPSRTVSAVKARRLRLKLYRPVGVDMPEDTPMPRIARNGAVTVHRCL
jgi:hypothetical protein